MFVQLITLSHKAQGKNKAEKLLKNFVVDRIGLHLLP